MSDALILSIGVLIAIGAAFGCVAVMNRVKKRPGPLQLILDRSPMFGKDFFDTYYADSPRHVVFAVRSEFAVLVGVPADFLLPGDNLAQLAPAGAAEAMRDYIAAFVGSCHERGGSIVVSERLATLDEFIRAAIDLCARERGAAGGQ